MLMKSTNIPSVAPAQRIGFYVPPAFEGGMQEEYTALLTVYENLEALYLQECDYGLSRLQNHDRCCKAKADERPRRSNILSEDCQEYYFDFEEPMLLTCRNTKFLVTRHTIFELPRVNEVVLMIDDMAVYIANLGKYNEGYLVGACSRFLLTRRCEEKIGLNEQYEYAIHDTDNFPIAIGEYVSIDELNEMYEMIENLLYIVEMSGRIYQPLRDAGRSRGTQGRYLLLSRL